MADVYFNEYEIHFDPVRFVCCRHTRMLIRKETLRNSVCLVVQDFKGRTPKCVTQNSLRCSLQFFKRAWGQFINGISAKRKSVLR